MSSSQFPGQVDSFTTMNDVSASDASDIQTYQNLLMTPNLDPTQQAQLTSLTQKLTSAGKILSSSQLNHLSDAITATQSYFLNTVNSDINNMENEFAAKVAKFSDQGAYNPATNYMDMNFVTWNGQSYICKQDNTVGIDPSHTSNWALVAQKGDKGDQGVPGAALSYVGTYNSASTYQQNQLVTYNGSTYICLQNNTTNVLPTNTAYWTLFVTGATPVAQSSAPTNPIINQLWIDTTSSTNPLLKYWDGSQWDLVPVPATTSELGLVLISATPQTGYPTAISTVEINAANGVMPLDANKLAPVANLPVASSSSPGIVKPTEGLIIDPDGNLKAPWSVKGLSSVLSPSRQSFTRSTPAGQINGTQVASNVLRLEQGRFHKAPFIEESTANTLSANQSNIETDTTGFSTATSTLIVTGATISRDTSTYYQGSASLKVVTTATSGEGVETSGISASANSSYTASVWVKVPSGQSMQLLMRDYTNSISATPISFTGTGQWQRVSITVTTGATAVTNLTMAVVTASATTVTFNIDCLQIENKGYMTTWVTGGITRNADSLSYTLDKPLASRFIHSFVVKPQQNSSILANRDYALGSIYSQSGSLRYKILWRQSDGKIHFIKTPDGTTLYDNISSAITFSAGDSIFVVVEDDQTAGQTNLYVQVNSETLMDFTLADAHAITDAQVVYDGCLNTTGSEWNGTIECILHELASGETVTTDEVAALFGASDWGLGDYPSMVFDGGTYIDGEGNIVVGSNSNIAMNAPSGNNAWSQPIYFNSRDSSGNSHQGYFQQDPNGVLKANSGSGTNALAQVLSGGYKIQSGQAGPFTPSTTGDQNLVSSVTFPVAYTSPPSIVKVGIVSTNGTSNISMVRSGGITASGFAISGNVITVGSSDSVYFWWEASGQ